MGSLVGSILGVNPNKASAPIRNFQPAGFSSSGLSGSFDKGSNIYNLTSSTGRNDAIDQLGSVFASQAQELNAMKASLAPGFGDLTKAGVNAISNRRREAIGNLRENLARRRVLGSSFAGDALTRAEAQFGQDEAAFRAQTKLQEIEATNKLILQETEARTNQFKVKIDQMNLDAGIAAQLSSGISGIMAQLAAAEAGIRSDSQTSVASSLLDVGGFFSGYAMGKK